MILNFHGKQKAIRAYAENNRLEVVHTDDDQPRTDGKTLWVPRPSPDWNPDEMLLWEYKVYHEMGHCMPMMCDVFDVMKSEKISMKSFLGYVWNLLDDHRQEYHDHATYEGIRKIMSRGRGLFLNAQVKACSADEPATNEEAACKALFAWDSYMRCDFQHECAGPAMAFIDKLDPKSLGYYNKLLESGDRFVTRNTTAVEELQITKDLLDYLGFDSKEEEDKAKGEGDPDEGDGDEGTCSGSKYLMHKHGDGEGESYADVEGDAPGGTGGDDVWGEYVPTEVTFKDIRYGTSTPIDIDINSEPMAKTVRKLIQVRAQSHYQHGLKRGKLGKNLHRALIPDAGAYGERVFKKKIISNTKDTSLLLLVDCSGSMNAWDKFKCAAGAAVLMNAALAPTGIPYAIVGFSYRGGSPEHFMFKDFNQKVSEDKLRVLFNRASCYLYDNADGESLLWAYNKIITQKTTKKMIITLSDGCPAASGTKGLRSFTQRVAESIEKEGIVDLYGIGIMDRSVKDFYKSHTVIRKPSELEGALLSVIKNRIL